MGNIVKTAVPTMTIITYYNDKIIFIFPWPFEIDIVDKTQAKYYNLSQGGFHLLRPLNVVRVLNELVGSTDFDSLLLNCATL